MSIDLNAIQKRADAATEGPWHAGRGATSDGTEFVRTHEQKAAFLALSLNEGESELWLVDNGAVIPAATGDGPQAKANSEFIAAARMDVPALLAYARDVEAQRDAARSVCHEREEELMELKGSCRAPSCILHRAHRGPCHVIRAALTATEEA